MNDSAVTQSPAVGCTLPRSRQAMASSPESKIRRMDVDSWFRLPEQSGVAAFAEAQVQLYRHDESLQDFFLNVQPNLRRCSGEALPQSLSRQLLGVSLETACKFTRPFTRRKFKTDILLCPMAFFARRTENEFLMRIIKGLAQTEASIVCLLSAEAPCRSEIESWLKAQKRENQVLLVDPASVLNPLTARLSPRLSRMRGLAVFDEVVDVLRPLGLSPDPASVSGFTYMASFVEAWRSFEESIEFESAVVRCHWQSLCGPVCRTSLRRGKTTITFQQGVIGHTLDAPVTASKFITFGDASASLLARMNRSFFQAVEKPEPPVQFFPGGSLFDKVVNLPNQFSKRTLLIMDEPVGADEIFSIGPERNEVFQLTEKLLRSPNPPRVIIRPHPYRDSQALEAWKNLIREFPHFAELSHAAWSLEDDLRRSSVVLGVFSGALTVAAASGLPTFFMVTEGGYATEDLACFGTSLPDQAFREIMDVLNNADSFAEARATALRNAREYYAGGTNLDLNGAFFERMLSPDTMGSASGAKPR